MVSSYLAEHTVIVFPFTQQPNGDETIIANMSNTVFLALPSSAADIITWLAQGKTVGEAQILHAQKYGDIPDMEDFLTLLENEGFVSPAIEVALDSNAPQASQRVSAMKVPPAKARRYHFESISQDVAQRFFSRPILLCCVALITIGLVLTMLDPSVLPPPQVLIFKQNLTVISIGIYLLIFVTVFLHEMAHLMAARAAGVSAQISISHRLWFLVAQTDITGIWMASKRQQYLAVLAGSLLDALMSSLFIILLFAQHHSWISIPSTLLRFYRVALFIYLLRLLWQCYLFVRTDFYYFLIILTNCKNLLSDTETFLLNQCARFLPFIRRVDQSAIPRREMRIVHIYVCVYLIGRIAAFVSLTFVTIPILTGYYFEMGIFFFRGRLPTSLTVADIAGWIVIVGVPIILQTLGLVLWLRRLFFARRSKNGHIA